MGIFYWKSRGGNAEPVWLSLRPCLLLLSGYLEGEEAILGKPAVLEVSYGEGRLILVGFNLHNRAQMVANFKVLFNAVAGG